MRQWPDAWPIDRFAESTEPSWDPFAQTDGYWGFLFLIVVFTLLLGCLTFLYFGVAMAAPSGVLSGWGLFGALSSHALALALLSTIAVRPFLNRRTQVKAAVTSTI